MKKGENLFTNRKNQKGGLCTPTRSFDPVLFFRAKRASEGVSVENSAFEV